VDGVEHHLAALDLHVEVLEVAARLVATPQPHLQGVGHVSTSRSLEDVVFAEQQVGAGVLDLEGTLLAQLAEQSPVERLPGARSVLLLAASYAKPAPTDWLWILAELRDDGDAPADAFDPERVGLTVSGGAVASPLVRLAPGLHRFAVAAPSGSGGAALEVALTFDGAPIVRRRIPIAVDHAVSEQGVTARGGCALERGAGSKGSLALAVALLLTVLRSRSWRRAARRDSRQDRTGARA
jgi:hypothetical protein